MLNPNVMRDNMHNSVMANERMAALANKGYHYQFVFARNAGHADRAVRMPRRCRRLSNARGRGIRSASSSSQGNKQESF